MWDPTLQNVHHLFSGRGEKRRTLLDTIVGQKYGSSLQVMAKSRQSLRVPVADFDGAWKEALERYLHGLMDLFFPAIGAQIAWESGIEFLDQELQQVVRDAKLGKRRVDKLVRVRLRDGTAQWILVHIEVASQPYVKLEATIFEYHHRLMDRFGKPVLSVAVLADASPTWRPAGVYESNVLGCRLRFEFPICKLLDFAKDWEALEHSKNPAAIVVMAHLRALETRESGDMEQRAGYKWQLTRMLLERGYQRKEVLELFRLLDWLLELPEQLKLAFRQQIVEYEKQKTMPFITSIELLGRKEGLKEGREIGRHEGKRELIFVQLEKRFGSLSPTTRQAIARLAPAALEQLAEAILDFGTLREAQKWLREHSTPRARK